MMRTSIATCVLLALVAAPAAAAQYEIRFRLTTAATYEALQFSVNYSGAGGDFVGSGASVACAANSALNVLPAFNKSSPNLHQALISMSGIQGAVRVTSCTFEAATAPAKSSFQVAVTAWESSSTSTAPTVTVSHVVLLP